MSNIVAKPNMLSDGMIPTSQHTVRWTDEQGYEHEEVTYIQAGWGDAMAFIAKITVGVSLTMLAGLAIGWLAIKALLGI